MSNSTSNNEPRKTLADFLSDNTANQILYNTVKQHAEIPDELILTAFIEAYAHCRDVIESPRLHTQRSETYTTMTDGIARSTLYFSNAFISVLFYGKISKTIISSSQARLFSWANRSNSV